jgi:hypothetical protein
MQVSIMGTPITGFGAHADASIILSAFAGFLAGGAAGGAGSLLMDAVRDRRIGGASRPKPGLGVPQLPRSGQGTV